MGTLKAISATVGVVLLVVAIVLAGWLAGWWFRTENTSREAQMNRHSYGYQQMLREQITKNIADVQGITVQITQTSDENTQTALKAQRKAIANMVCEEATQVYGDPLPSDQAQFVGLTCYNGSLSPSSPYYSQ